MRDALRGGPFLPLTLLTLPSSPQHHPSDTDSYPLLQVLVLPHSITPVAPPTGLAALRARVRGWSCPHPRWRQRVCCHVFGHKPAISDKGMGPEHFEPMLHGGPMLHPMLHSVGLDLRSDSVSAAGLVLRSQKPMKWPRGCARRGARWSWCWRARR